MTIRIKKSSNFVYAAGPLAGNPIAVSGSSGAVQYSDNGVFGGDSNFSFNKYSKTLSVTNLSGSLTKLSDGSSYLIAGSNITISTGSKGSITISSTGGGGGGSGTPAGSDSEIQFNSGGSFGSSPNFTFSGNYLSLTGSMSQGNSSKTSGTSSHAEGYYTIAGGNYSHSEGYGTETIGANSHAEGESTVSTGQSSHAEGGLSTSSGFASHAEGLQTKAEGDGSHAEGYQTIAKGNSSHAEGRGTIASGSYQLVVGQYNVKNNDSSLFVVGNGWGDFDVYRSDVLRIESGSLGNGKVQVTGSIEATTGLSGSLTRLTDGRSYLVAGQGISIVSSSNSPVTVSSTLLPVRHVIPASIILPNTNNSNYVRAGIINFDPSAYAQSSDTATRSIYFTAYLEVQPNGGPGLSCEVRVVDLFSNSVVATLSSTANPGDPPQNARQYTADLNSTVGLYSLSTFELQMRRVGGNPLDAVFCSLGQFEINYT